MQTYIIPVFWTMMNDVKIKANSLEEAMIKAREIDLPEKNSLYVDGSFEVSCIDVCKAANNIE